MLGPRGLRPSWFHMGAASLCLAASNHFQVFPSQTILIIPGDAKMITGPWGTLSLKVRATRGSVLRGKGDFLWGIFQLSLPSAWQ